MKVSMSLRFAFAWVISAVLSKASAEGGNDSCHDLQVTQSYCLESYGACADKPCEPIQLADDASCFQANYLFCKYNIPDCCCGQHMIDAVECRIPNCKIDCETLVQASSTEECTSEAMVLTSCLTSLDSGIHDCQSQKCPESSFVSIQSDTSCEELSEQICSANIPKCCCRQEMIANAECSYRKLHGVDCVVQCDIDQEEELPENNANEDVTNAPSSSVSPGTVAAATGSDTSLAMSRIYYQSALVAAAVCLLGTLV